MRDSLRVSLHRNLCFSKFLWHSLSLFWIFVTAVVISLRLLYDDPASSYQELLTRSGHSSLHVRRLRMIAMEVYKSLNNINPEFMWELFQKKETEYNFRDSFKVDIPSFKTLKYGKYSFSYYGAHLWNILPINIKQSLSQTNFKMVLSSWDGPNCSCSYCDFKPWDL